MSLEERYQRAVEDIGFRQEFLDSLRIPNDYHFIGRVSYKRRNIVIWYLNEEKVSPPMMHTFDKLSRYIGFILSKMPKSSIFVFPSAFSESFNFFMSAIYDHEIFHAKQHFYLRYSLKRAHSPDLRKYFVALIECAAYRNQIESPRFDNLSTEGKDRIHRNFAKYFREAMNRSDLDDKVLEDIKLFLVDEKSRSTWRDAWGLT